ncbi:MAG: hypothetical protein KC609_24050 [Myxococcales bacterium]|nr:hypothetical protein [Myxococcales bacterium]
MQPHKRWKAAGMTLVLLSIALWLWQLEARRARSEAAATALASAKRHLDALAKRPSIRPLAADGETLRRVLDSDRAKTLRQRAPKLFSELQSAARAVSERERELAATLVTTTDFAVGITLLFLVLAAGLLVVWRGIELQRRARNSAR